jgi:hypothetical protein
MFDEQTIAGDQDAAGVGFQQFPDVSVARIKRRTCGFRILPDRVGDQVRRQAIDVLFGQSMPSAEFRAVRIGTAGLRGSSTARDRAASPSRPERARA